MIVIAIQHNPDAPAEAPTDLAAFAAALRRHDPTYPFSDDRKEYLRGVAERTALINAAKLLPRGDVAVLVTQFAQRTLIRGVEQYVVSFLKERDQ